MERLSPCKQSIVCLFDFSSLLGFARNLKNFTVCIALRNQELLLSHLESLLGPLATTRSETAAINAFYKSLERTVPEFATQLRSLELINLLSKEPALTLMPFRMNVR